MPRWPRAHTAAGRRVGAAAGLLLVAGLIPMRVAGGSPASLLPPSFARVATGPGGGTVWAGRIRDPLVPALARKTVVYLPPGASAGSRYPVVYLLQGFRGSPWQFVAGLRIASVADRAITSGAVRPFIAVAPPAGITRRYDGEWAGAWENYLVDDVVPWTDAHLPTLRTTADRVLAGLSAGGFGALDIGLRHPGLFGTLEAWSGYFSPFHDGPFRDAGVRELTSHDPSLLVLREASALHRLGTRVYLSSGSTHDRWTTGVTVAFARELAALRVPYSLYLAPGGHDGRFWRSQLPEALRFALPGRV